MSEEQNLKLTKSQLARLKSADELECVPLHLSKLLYSQGDGFIVIFEAEEKSVGFPLNSFEGTMLSFVQSGCARFAHIKNIYQVFLGLLSDIGARIEMATVEARQGDIIYAQLALRDKANKRIFTTVSFADAVILSLLSECELNITRKVLLTLEEFDEWTYRDEIIDQKDGEE